MLQQYMQQPQQNQQQQRPQQQGQQPPNDLLGRAFLLAATSGKQLGETIPIAAQMFQQENAQQQQRYQAQMEQQQALEEQQQSKTLADYFKNNPDASPTDAAAALFGQNVKSTHVAALVNALTGGNKDEIVNDTQFGGGHQIVHRRGGKIQGLAPLGQAQNQGQSMVKNQSTPQEEAQTIEAIMNAGDRVPDNVMPNEMAKPKQSLVEQFTEQLPEPSKERIPLREKEINIKDYNDFRKNKLAPKLEAATEIKENISEIANALDKFTTGSFAEQRLELKKIGRFLNIDNAEEVAAGELIQKASNKLVLDFAKSMGGGVVSDKDIVFLKQMVPSLAASPGGNKKIIEYFDRVAKRQADYARGADAYYNKQGHLRGFDTAWYNFNERNPVFTPQEREQMVQPQTQRQQFGNSALMAEKERRKNAR